MRCASPLSLAATNSWIAVSEARMCKPIDGIECAGVVDLGTVSLETKGPFAGNTVEFPNTFDRLPSISRAAGE